MIVKDGKILLGKRRGSHGAGKFAFPGGHLEYMESFEECARREVREETGIEIQNVRFLFLQNFKDYAPKHFAHISIIADWKSGEAQVLEPEKCEGWDWYDMDDLPEPYFINTHLYVEALRTGKNYFDA